jgi:hypothetical protein
MKFLLKMTYSVDVCHFNVFTTFSYFKKDPDPGPQHWLKQILGSDSNPELKKCIMTKRLRLSLRQGKAVESPALAPAPLTYTVHKFFAIPKLCCSDLIMLYVVFHAFLVDGALGKHVCSIGILHFYRNNFGNLCKRKLKSEMERIEEKGVKREREKKWGDEENVKCLGGTWNHTRREAIFPSPTPLLPPLIMSGGGGGVGGGRLSLAC